MPAAKLKPVGDHAAILEELYGQRCQCGRRKVAGVTFCPNCIKKLPVDIWRTLSAGGAGYDAAYAIALGYLHGLKKRRSGGGR